MLVDDFNWTDMLLLIICRVQEHFKTSSQQLYSDKKSTIQSKNGDTVDSQVTSSTYLVLLHALSHSASIWKESSFNVLRQEQCYANWSNEMLVYETMDNPTILHTLYIHKTCMDPTKWISRLVWILDAPFVHYGGFCSCLSSFFNMKLMTFQSKPRYWSHRMILDFLVSLGTFWPLNHCFEAWV